MEFSECFKHERSLSLSLSLSGSLGNVLVKQEAARVWNVRALVYKKNCLEMNHFE